MNFDDLKDQLKEQWATLWGEIQENQHFQTLREKYETLPINQQKLIISASIVLVVLFLMSIPLGYFSTSEEYTASFEEQRTLTQELLKIGKPRTSPAQNLDQLTIEMVKSKLLTSVGSAGLLPDQVGEVKELGKTEGSLAKASIKEQSLSIEVKTLNLNQIMEIGYRLQGMLPSVKLTGLQMVADAKMTDYFNVNFILSQFLPPKDDSNTAKGRRLKKRQRNK